MNSEITRVGIKRKVDKLGRIVIPKGYREFYHLFALYQQKIVCKKFCEPEINAILSRF